MNRLLALLHQVSIRAPVRARPAEVSLAYQKLTVSIRAPVRARRIKLKLNCTLFGFNPRAREGATLESFTLSWVALVSIRAPVRARHKTFAYKHFHAGFNPRAREGATWATSVSRLTIAAFQSARP